MRCSFKDRYDSGGNSKRSRKEKGESEQIELRHDVLCGCGWGKIAILESEIPYACPMCGHVFIPEEDEE